MSFILKKVGLRSSAAEQAPPFDTNGTPETETTAYANYKMLTTDMGFFPGTVALELAKKHPLDEVIDDLGNTILHVIVDSPYICPFELDRLLSTRNFTTLEPRNQEGQTPLEITIAKGLTTCFRVLAAHAGTPSQCKEMQNILEVLRALDFPIKSDDMMLSAMLKCFKDGTSLKTLLDNSQNTLPYLLLEKGFSPSLVDLLSRNDRGIDLDKTLNPDAWSVYSESIYSEIVKEIDQRILKNPDEDRINVVFYVFVKYCSRAPWKYSTDVVKYQWSLLREPAKGEYQVNCFALSRALTVIFAAYGIFDTQYEVIESPKNQCIRMLAAEEFFGTALGKYRLFDGSVKNNEPVLFGRHCVVVIERRGNDLYFDPTFSCVYFKKNAPIDYLWWPLLNTRCYTIL